MGCHCCSSVSDLSDFHFGTKPTRVKLFVTAKGNLCVAAWMNQSVNEDMVLHQPSYTRTEISVVNVRRKRLALCI